MKLLIFLANAFIDTFGITHPSPEAAEKTAKILAYMMLAVVVVIVVVASLILHAIYH